MAWNRQIETTSVKQAKKAYRIPIVIYVLAAIFLIVVVTVMFCTTNQEVQSTSKMSRRPSMVTRQQYIKEAESTVWQTHKDEETIFQPHEKKKPFSQFTRRNPEESRAELEARKAAGENIRNLSIGPDGKPRYKLRFTNPAEREIERILIHTPGEPMMGVVPYDKNFERRFAESLVSKVEILPDDTPADIEIKQVMEETKKEIAERIKNGETLKDILEESRKEIDRLARYRTDLMSLINEARKNNEYSDEDVSDYIDAANKMLSDNGMKPINKTIFTRRAVRRMAEGQTIGGGNGY